MVGTLQRYFVPGLVIQSVLIGATYATGRETTEFFLKSGPFPGLIGLFVTIILYSLSCMVAFELARQYRVTDYKSFCKVYMGRLWFLYEIGFLYGVLITLSVIAAAASEFASDMMGAPKLATALTMMVVISALVYLKTSWIERIMSIWSVLFFSVFALVLVLGIVRFGNEIGRKLEVEAVHLDAIWSAAIYTAFSLAILPVLIFVARHFRTRKEALVAGSLCGPIVFLPALAIFLVLLPFHPAIVDAPIPISIALERLDSPNLVLTVQIAILGTLALTGAGLLHGANERIANTMKEHRKQLPAAVRPGLALAAMVFSVFLATEVGIIDLVAQGFRYAAYVFVLVMVLPLVTRGFWMLGTGRPAQ